MSIQIKICISKSVKISQALMMSDGYHQVRYILYFVYVRYYRILNTQQNLTDIKKHENRFIYSNHWCISIELYLLCTLMISLSFRASPGLNCCGFPNRRATSDPLATTCRSSNIKTRLK